MAIFNPLSTSIARVVELPLARYRRLRLGVRSVAVTNAPAAHSRDLGVEDRPHLCA
jgi:hypothetical protein